MIRCVVGLGNPGTRYTGTRHNLGCEIVERYADSRGARWRWRLWRSYWHALTDDGIILARPATYMNHSGTAVAALQKKFSCAPGNFLIVYDDVHLPLGRLRARRGGRDGGHNGLADIITALQTRAIPRLRVGIGDAADRVTHVLSPFTSDERPRVSMACDAAVTAIHQLCTSSWDTVVQRINATQGTSAQ